MDWLLELYDGPRDGEFYFTLLEAAVVGCDLATIQRLYGIWLDYVYNQPALGKEEEEQERERERAAFASYKVHLLKVATCSLTADWAAKVEWLEGEVECPRASINSRAAGALPDAVDRLRWLQQRGDPVDFWVCWGAARAGKAADLQRLLDEFGFEIHPYAPVQAAMGGHLAALQVLHERGCPPNYNALVLVLEGGHLEVVDWLVQVLGVKAGLNWMVGKAAKSGNVELLSWLYDRGCRGNPDALIAAAMSGCVAAIEWLVKRD